MRLPALVLRLAALQAAVAGRLTTAGATIQASDPVSTRTAVFARELLAIGPWRTVDALKGAHRRGVLREGEHWDWVGGARAYYVERMFPGFTGRAIGPSGKEDDHAQATARRLHGVLAQLPLREAPARVARDRPCAPGPAPVAELADGRAGHARESGEVAAGTPRGRRPPRPGRRSAAASR